MSLTDDDAPLEGGRDAGARDPAPDEREKSSKRRRVRHVAALRREGAWSSHRALGPCRFRLSQNSDPAWWYCSVRGEIGTRASACVDRLASGLALPPASRTGAVRYLLRYLYGPRIVQSAAAPLQWMTDSAFIRPARCTVGVQPPGDADGQNHDDAATLPGRTDDGGQRA